MVKQLVLKDHILTYLKLSNIGFEELAKKIGANSTSLHNWSQGAAITLNARNLKSLNLLAEQMDIDLPFLIFPIESMERYHSEQKFNEVIAPHLQGLWSGISREIRDQIKKEMNYPK